MLCLDGMVVFRGEDCGVCGFCGGHVAMWLLWCCRVACTGLVRCCWVHLRIIPILRWHWRCGVASWRGSVGLWFICTGVVGHRGICGRFGLNFLSPTHFGPQTLWDPTRLNGIAVICQRKLTVSLVYDESRYYQCGRREEGSWTSCGIFVSPTPVCPPRYWLSCPRERVPTCLFLLLPLLRAIRLRFDHACLEDSASDSGI